MRDISMRLSAMSLDERRELPCIGHERADLVVAGCAILECILDIWPAERLGVADRGIREGILRGLMERDGIALLWESGRAWCGERVWQAGWNSVGRVALKK